MGRAYGVPLNLNKNELQNARVQNLASAPGSPVTGQIYYDTGTSKLYYYNGSAWIDASGSVTFGATGDMSASAEGDTVAAGSSGKVSDAGHRHAREAFGTSAAAIGTSAGGTATTPSKSDHVHATGAGTPSTQAFSDSAAVGAGPAASMTDHKHAMPAHGSAAHSAISISDLAVPTANVAFNSKKITGLLDPTSAQDAATKTYVDAAAAGIDWKASVRAATTANGTLASAYANGQTVDGVTLATGNRILLKNQTTGAENGIYTVNASGAPTRATDADASAEVTAGMAVFVEEGTVNADTGWLITNDGAITLGTTALVFAQFTSLGQVTAGAGLTKTGSTIDVIGGTGITVAADLVSIDTAVVSRKYAATIGDNSATSFNVDHNFGTADVQVQVYQISDGAQIEPDITRTTTNRVVIAFTTAPTSSQYRVTVQG